MVLAQTTRLQEKGQGPGRPWAAPEQLRGVGGIGAGVMVTRGHKGNRALGWTNRTGPS